MGPRKAIQCRTAITNLSPGWERPPHSCGTEMGHRYRLDLCFSSVITILHFPTQGSNTTQEGDEQLVPSPGQENGPQGSQSIPSPASPSGSEVLFRSLGCILRHIYMIQDSNDEAISIVSSPILGPSSLPGTQPTRPSPSEIIILKYPIGASRPASITNGDLDRLRPRFSSMTA
ncbi:hypothetical protein BD779DRAFT_761494 [Infundibulicybe gibba]|nr:hypothetical protein BD779DRAFT_761494 [Infundibulicybe gibba]